MLAPPLVELRDVWKSFEANQVLRGISLELHRGTTLAVMGGSGAGMVSMNAFTPSTYASRERRSARESWAKSACRSARSKPSRRATSSIRR